MSKFRVCPICDGEGSYVNPAIDSDGLTSDDLADAEFATAYFAGLYDKPCSCCQGRRVVTEAEFVAYGDRLDDFRTMMAESGELYADSRL